MRHIDRPGFEEALVHKAMALVADRRRLAEVRIGAPAHLALRLQKLPGGAQVVLDSSEVAKLHSQVRGWGHTYSPPQPEEKYHS